MKNRQHRSIAGRIQKARALPRALERRRFRFAVTHHGGDDEIRVVEGGAERVCEHVSQLPAFVNRAWRGDAHVARYAAGRGELAEQTTKPADVARHLRVHLRVRAFEVDVRHNSRPAVSGTG